MRGWAHWPQTNLPASLPPHQTMVSLPDEDAQEWQKGGQPPDLGLVVILGVRPIDHSDTNLRADCHIPRRSEIMAVLLQTRFYTACLKLDHSSLRARRPTAPASAARLRL